MDSFILKFRNLWQAGWNAKLSLESIHGKVEVNLSVELGDAPVFLRIVLHNSDAVQEGCCSWWRKDC